MIKSNWRKFQYYSWLLFYNCVWVFFCFVLLLFFWFFFLTVVFIFNLWNDWWNNWRLLFVFFFFTRKFSTWISLLVIVLILPFLSTLGTKYSSLWLLIKGELCHGLTCIPWFTCNGWFISLFIEPVNHHSIHLPYWCILN